MDFGDEQVGEPVLPEGTKLEGTFMATVITEQKTPRDELIDLVKQRANVEEILASLERDIYEFEGAFLQDTRETGNVLIGFKLNTEARDESPKSKKGRDTDRIVSNSSVSFRPCAVPAERPVATSSAAIRYKTKVKKVLPPDYRGRGRPRKQLIGAEPKVGQPKFDFASRKRFLKD